MSENPHTLDLDAFKRRLGTDYWRTLEELADSEAFNQYMQDEFPRHAEAAESAVDRRDFVKLMSASLAMTGLAACAPPTEKILPYVKMPEEIVPGKPLFFATAMTIGGVATGVLVESHMGRPTKVEGNPDHPASLGATDPFAQASILTLYDPERSQTVRYVGNVSTWNEFLGALQLQLARQREKGGAGLRLLTETITSPTMGAQIRAILQRYPNARWYQWEPATADNAREGSRLAFGSYANTVYRFDQASVVVSLDADFLGCSGAWPVRYVREFMSRRRIREGVTSMSRLYAIEASVTTTGSVADNRLPMRASDIADFSEALGAAVGAGGRAGEGHGDSAKWVAAIAKDLMANRGASIVVAGEGQPPHVHALAHAMNQALGNVGRTVFHTDSIEVNPVNQNALLTQLVAEMNSGAVEMLVMIGGNPVYTAPADLGFTQALEKVPMRTHMSLYYDETSSRSHWHVPETHYLEMWSDARAYDGTVSIIQPLIAPLYNGRSPHELLAALVEDTTAPYDIVRNTWRAAGGADAENFWRRALHDGIVPNTTLPPTSRAGSTAPPATGHRPPATGGIEVVFRADPTVHDGRFANNAWLQELPKPLTKLTWDNVVHISPPMAGELNVENGDVVSLTYRGGKVSGPVWITPGHAQGSVTVHLGYGRSRAGKVGNGLGFNAYIIRPHDGQSMIRGAEIAKTGGHVDLACAQMQQHIDQRIIDRPIIHDTTFAEFQKHPDFVHAGAHGPAGELSMYPAFPYDGYKWAMVIDTSVCTGCNGCVIACQSENNIPIVGKKQVIRGREMHWLRIDHYYKGDPENPEHFHEPVPCMQCENAPCEPVCPVGATAHSPEGLNDMAYNRCVGTRYCSNNCPYKVRRFNYFQFADYKTESLKLMNNPDVTIRSRGVMEKCTYCVQRINESKRAAEIEGRQVRDGEFTTACAQACPADAIVFGNLNDANSRVAQLAKQPHNFSLLEELNTKPRTTYLATIRNPNPELKAAKPAAGEHH